MAKSKGRKGLGDLFTEEFIKSEYKLSLLEERLLKGEISEQTYRELKEKYSTHTKPEVTSEVKAQLTSVRCHKCSNIWEVELKQRPFEIRCPKCRAKGLIK
jgi:DNA-directed RNA polymerase subunit RPC12/RpoP